MFYEVSESFRDGNSFSKHFTGNRAAVHRFDSCLDPKVFAYSLGANSYSVRRRRIVVLGVYDQNL